MLVKGVDLSGIERIAKYKQEHEDDKDVLELYDDKLRESQQSFHPKPPSTHVSSRGDFGAEAYKSFYDGSGRYSNKTYDLVNHYLSQKPEYDSRRYEVPETSRSQLQLNTINRAMQDYSMFPSSTQNSQLAQLLQQSKNLGGPSGENYMSKSLSMKELNSRIRHTIDANRRSYKM